MYNAWADGIIGRYGLHECWDLNLKQEEEIFADFVRECPDDVREVMVNLDDSTLEQMIADPLIFALMVKAAIVTAIESILESELDVYLGDE